MHGFPVRREEIWSATNQNIILKSQVIIYIIKIDYGHVAGNLK